MNSYYILISVAIITSLIVTVNPLSLATAQQLSNQNSTTTEFVDEDNEFSIQIPAGWEVTPQENRFDSTDLTITSPAGVESGSVIIQYSIVDTTIKNLMEDLNINSKKIQKNLDDYFPHVLSGVKESFDGYTQIEDAQYDKYQIDGNKIASVVFTFDESNNEYAALYLFTVVNEKKLNIMYTASTSEFDANLNTANEMIKSIKLLD